VDEARLEVVRPDGRALTAVAAGHEVKCRWRRAEWRPQGSATRRGPVPRYDVRCRACGTTFEVNRPMARADEPAPCPSGHDDTVRLLPTVGLTGRAGGTRTATAPAPAAGGGGCCGGGCCG
jgi:putative FmdB family regulatory protein